MSKIHSFSAGSSPGRVTADFFTDSHRFSASVVVYKRRLVDVLADQMTNFLDLVDVYVSRNNNPGEIVHTYQRGSLVKEEINFIVLPSEAQAISKERFYSPVSVPQLVPERHQYCPVAFPAGRSEFLIDVLLEVGQDRVVVEKRWARFT